MLKNTLFLCNNIIRNKKIKLNEKEKKKEKKLDFIKKQGEKSQRLKLRINDKKYKMMQRRLKRGEYHN